MTYLFYLATPLIIASGIPQTIRLLQRKRSDDISILMFFFTWLAVFILLLNSIHVKDMSLTLANGASFVSVTINLLLILNYRRDA